MSINQCKIQFSNTSLINENEMNSPLLQMPAEVLDRIGFWVAQDTASGQNDAARNAVIWGRVCVRLHLSSHGGRVAQIIEQAQMENDALQKIWNHISNQFFVFQGNPPSTLAEIKAWFDFPSNNAAKISIEKLDLRNLKLKAIPPQISKFAHLEELVLDNNQISVIPDSLGNCPLLK